MRHKVTGKVYREYMQRPRKQDIENGYISGKKEETLGQLEIVKKGTPVSRKINSNL